MPSLEDTILHVLQTRNYFPAARKLVFTGKYWTKMPFSKQTGTLKSKLSISIKTLGVIAHSRITINSISMEKKTSQILIRNSRGNF